MDLRGCVYLWRLEINLKCSSNACLPQTSWGSRDSFTLSSNSVAVLLRPIRYLHSGGLFEEFLDPRAEENQENTWSTAGLSCIYTIWRIPHRRWPRCSWHTRHQNQMWLTPTPMPTPMGHQEPTNWCLRRSRATSYSLATPDVQGKRNHDRAQWARPRPTVRGFSMHMRLPVPEITLPSAATLGQPAAWPSISRIC